MLLEYLGHDSHLSLGIESAVIPGFDELERDFTGAVLGEVGKLAEEVLAPLNPVGDAEGCTLENGVVRTPTGFEDAYNQLRAGGWLGLDADPAYGGQGMPYLLHSAVGEMFVSANMAFNMYQGLTYRAYAAIHAHASEDQKATYQVVWGCRETIMAASPSKLSLSRSLQITAASADRFCVIVLSLSFELLERLCIGFKPAVPVIGLGRVFYPRNALAVGRLPCLPEVCCFF